MHEQFFKNLALYAGTNDISTTKKIYNGLIRMIVKNCDKGKSVLLPDFGMFHVHIRRTRRRYDINLRAWVAIGPIPTIKFKACKNLKRHIKAKVEV